MRGHNVACECSPEVALKIQFLRLVHSFCDHSDYKHLLLTVPEMRELDAINTNAGMLAVRNVPDVDITWLCSVSRKNKEYTDVVEYWAIRFVRSHRSLIISLAPLIHSLAPPCLLCCACSLTHSLPSS